MVTENNPMWSYTESHPPENGGYEREVDFFMDAMLYKLNHNRHKGKWEDLDLKATLKKLRDEVDELEKAMHEGNAIEIILEAADVANYAMIAANIAIRDGG